MAKEADACVLFYRWHRKWKLGGHFVALHHTDRGFLGYNTYRNSAGADPYGSSIAAFLKEKKYYLPVLIAINRPKGDTK